MLGRLLLALALVAACAGPAQAPMMAPKAFDPVKAAVARSVLVTVDCEDNDFDTGGTAVLYASGIAVTAAHVVDSVNPNTCKVSLSTEFDNWAASVLAYDSERDIGVLRTNAYDVTQVGLSHATLGMDIWSVGYPSQIRSDGNGAQALTVTRGVVAAVNVEPHMHRITAPVFYGNSGGGVWSDTGGLVGLTIEIRFWRGQYIESQGRIVPAADVEEFVREALK